MKIITQQEYESFPIDEHGIKHCPTGDYSGIKEFPNKCVFAAFCSFAECCRFGEGCRFGEWCSIEGGHVLVSYFGIDRIGSRNGKTYFFNCEDGFFVRCGGFFGTIEEFEHEVIKTHAQHKKHREGYIAAIELAKILFQ